MRRLTIFDMFIGCWITVASMNSNAAMLRMDFKGTATPLGGFPFLVDGSFSDLAIGDPIQGYFLINTDANYVATSETDPNQNRHYTLKFPSSSDIQFVQGSVSIGKHTFDTSTSIPGSEQGVIVNSAPTSRYIVSFDTSANAHQAMEFDIITTLSPGTFMNTNLQQSFDATKDGHSGQFGEGNLSFVYADTAGAVEIGGDLNEVSLSVVPIPASVWLLASALLTLLSGAWITGKLSGARQWSLSTP